MIATPRPRHRQGADEPRRDGEGRLRRQPAPLGRRCTEGVTAGRRELISAQFRRPDLTYALRHLAVQARVKFARVHLVLADLVGAMTLMREIDELVRRCLDLGVLAGEALALRAPGREAALLKHRWSVGAGRYRAAPAAAVVYSPAVSPKSPRRCSCLSRNAVKSQAVLIYRKLDASSRGQAATRSRQLGLLEGMTTCLSSHKGDGICSRHGVEWCPAAREAHGPDGEIPGDFAEAGDDRRRLRRKRGQARTLPGRDIGAGSQDRSVAASRGVGGHRVARVRLEWSVGRALSAGASEDEIADMLLAIARWPGSVGWSPPLRCGDRAWV